MDRFEKFTQIVKNHKEVRVVNNGNSLLFEVYGNPVFAIKQATPHDAERVAGVQNGVIYLVFDPHGWNTRMTGRYSSAFVRYAFAGIHNQYVQFTPEFRHPISFVTGGIRSVKKTPVYHIAVKGFDGGTIVESSGTCPAWVDLYKMSLVHGGTLYNFALTKRAEEFVLMDI